MALENAVAVAELADIAWTKYARKLDVRANASLREKEALAAESALAREQWENKRLQATLDEYKQALLELQERVSGVEWLGKKMNTTAGTMDVYERLEQKVNSPDFLQMLQLPPEVRGQSSAQVATRFTERDGLEINVDVDDASWWLWVTDKNMYSVPTEDTDGLDGSGYVVVDKDDVIDGIANFIARYLVVHPDTKHMTPKQLQEAIGIALAELRYRGAVRKLWDWGKFLYTTGSWFATVFSIYRNPLIVRGTLIAIWTSTRVILGLIR